jgi:hypothetical protein
MRVAHKMPDDAKEFEGAIQALLDRYPKDRILAALQETPSRPGPKRKDDSQMLIRMGQIMTWHRDLSDRAAAEIVTRHLPNNRRSVIDRIRKSFSKDREIYLRIGKSNEIIRLMMAAEKATRSTGENDQGGDDSEGVGRKEPLITLVLPDDNTLEATFQELRSTLSAVCKLTDKDPVVVFRPGRNLPRINPKWDVVQRE